MAERVVHSPKHGELRVVFEQHPVDEQGRSWSARLDPRPPRLAHVIACHGQTGDEALEVLTAAVERYDAQGLVPRARIHD